MAGNGTSKNRAAEIPVRNGVKMNKSGTTNEIEGAPILSRVAMRRAKVFLENRELFIAVQCDWKEEK